MARRSYRYEPAEKEYQATVVEYARLRGWLVYHPFDSRHSEAGFPDLTMAKGPRVICAELKRDSEEPTPAQRAWLAALAAGGIETYVWKPSTWDEIVEVLSR